MNLDPAMFPHLNQSINELTPENRAVQSSIINEMIFKNFEILVMDLIKHPEEFEQYGAIQEKIKKISPEYFQEMNSQLLLIQKIAQIITGSQLDFDEFYNIELPSDLPLVRMIKPHELKIFVMAALVNKNQIPLTIFTKEEIITMGPQLSYADLRMAENWSAQDIHDVLKACPYITELRLVSNEVETLPPLPHCEKLQCHNCPKLIDISEIPNCESFEISWCHQLKEFPLLDTCKNFNFQGMQEIAFQDTFSECHEFQITCYHDLKLPDLPVCESFEANSPNLTKIPELPLCKNISVLNCYSLKELPYLPKCTFLRTENCPKLIKHGEMPLCQFMKCINCSLYDNKAKSQIDFQELKAKEKIIEEFEAILPSFEKFRLPKDIEEINKIIPANLKAYVVAHLINRDQVSLLHFSKEEIMEMSLYLTHVDLTDASWSGPELIEIINACYNLTHLYINSLEIETLPSLPHCKFLNCSGSSISKLPDLSHCVKLFCNNMPNLKFLPHLPSCLEIYCNDCPKLLFCAENLWCTTFSCNNCPDLSSIPELPNCEDFSYLNCPSLVDHSKIPNKFKFKRVEALPQANLSKSALQNQKKFVQFQTQQGPVHFYPDSIKAEEAAPSLIEISLIDRLHAVQELGPLTVQNFSQHAQHVLNHFYKKPLPPEDQITVPNLQGEIVRWNSLDSEQQNKIIAANKKGMTSQLVLNYEGPIYCQKIIPRWSHGCMHVSRAAMEVNLIAQMYKKYDPDHFQFTQEDILLAQYLTIFHDSARQTEGVDVWDASSAENARAFLTASGFSEDKVNQAIDDLKNKDNPDQSKRSPLARLIHDADCLDIMRIYTLNNFNNKYLDIFNDLMDKPGFLEDLEQLKTELYSLIELTEKPFIKIHLETQSNNYYQEVLGLAGSKDTGHPRFPLLKTLLENELGNLPKTAFHTKSALKPEGGWKENDHYSPGIGGMGIVKNLLQTRRGGVNQSYIVGNESGKLFFWKEGNPITIHSEIGSSQLASYLTGGLVPIAVKQSLQPENFPQPKEGTLQPYIEMKRGPFDPKVNNEGFDPSQLNGKQKAQFFAHMIADRIISNYDTHTGQFRIDDQGNVIGYDKGQAYKYFEDRAKSSFNREEPPIFDPDFYHPPILPNQPTYSNFCQYLMQNPLELKGIWNSLIVQETLQRCKNLSSKLIKDCLIDYAMSSFEEQEEEFIEKIKIRAQCLEQDLKNYFSSVVNLPSTPEIENQSVAADLSPLPVKIRIFLDMAREDVFRLSIKELEGGWEEAVNAIDQIKDPGDQTTLIKITEIISSHKILVESNFERAFQMRMKIGKAIPPSPFFAMLGTEVSKVSIKFGLRLQPLSTSLLKNHCLTIQKRVYQNGDVRIQLDAKLKVKITEKESLDRLFAKLNPAELQKALPPNFCPNVTIGEEDIVYEKREDLPGENFAGHFSNDPQNGYAVKSFILAKARKYQVIHFEGVGDVKIGTDPDCLTEYGHLSIVLDPKVSEQEAVVKLHLLLAAVGLGTLSSLSREEDVERKKILQLFRAYYPAESSDFEQSPDIFHISIKKLKQEIVAIVPEMQEKIDLHLDQMYLQEVFPGQSEWSVQGISKEVRNAGGWGLMAGVQGEFDEAKNVLMNILKSGSLSTQDRFTTGIIVGGPSPEPDFESGGANSTFSRLITSKMSKNPYEYRLSGGLQILFNLKIIERVGFCHNSDLFGNKDPSDYHNRPSILDLAKQIESSQDPNVYKSNEVCLRNRIPPEYIQGIMVSTIEQKNELIEIMEQKGFITNDPQLGKCYRGTLIATFIHIGEMEERYWTLED